MLYVVTALHSTPSPLSCLLFCALLRTLPFMQWLHQVRNGMRVKLCSSTSRLLGKSELTIARAVWCSSSCFLTLILLIARLLFVLVHLLVILHCVQLSAFPTIHFPPSSHLDSSRATCFSFQKGVYSSVLSFHTDVHSVYSWRHHHVHDVHSVSFSETSCLFGHLALSART